MAGTSHWHVDCQLLAWDGESSSHGATIKLLFQEEGDLDFFKAMTLHKGRFFSKVGDKKHVCGQILKCAFELSDDDDQKAEMAEPVVAKARPQEDWIRCPDCDEHSRNLEGSACFTCGGTGMVKKKKRHVGQLELKAYELCRDNSFWKFAGIKNKEEAAIFLKSRCGVVSRGDIGKSKESAIAFGRVIVEFETWVNDQTT